MANDEFIEWLEEEGHSTDLESRLNYLFRYADSGEVLEEDIEAELSYITGGR